MANSHARRGLRALHLLGLRRTGGRVQPRRPSSYDAQPCTLHEDMGGGGCVRATRGQYGAATWRTRAPIGGAQGSDGENRDAVARTRQHPRWMIVWGLTLSFSWDIFVDNLLSFDHTLFGNTRSRHYSRLCVHGGEVDNIKINKANHSDRTK